MYACTSAYVRFNYPIVVASVFGLVWGLCCGVRGSGRGETCKHLCILLVRATRIKAPLWQCGVGKLACESVEELGAPAAKRQRREVRTTTARMGSKCRKGGL